MTRTVERLEGLGLLGRASLGPVSVPTPGLLESRRPEEKGPGLSLSSTTAPPGQRHLVLSDGETRLELTFPVLAPEVLPTPGGLHPVGDRAFLLHCPLAPETEEELRARRPELLVFANARSLWAEGEPFVQALKQIRTGVGAAPVLWAPRVALPHRLPLLAYLGVDLVDTTEGLLAAARGEFLDPTLGVADASAARSEAACDCPACTADPLGSLELHTVVAYRRAIAESRAAARAGRLRELVEARLTSEPTLAEMLRFADRGLAALLEERTPVSGQGSHNYVLAESHRRPEMGRFRTRFLERYRPPPSKSVLVLVPCSKSKPYRHSRSHRRFLSALEGIRAIERVHVVSVSSPLGVVPRELEDLPPARHYDIPVTGDWTENERAIVIAGVDHLLREGRYRAVVVHLDPGEYSFLRDRLPTDVPVRWTLSDGRTTSQEALASLRGAVTEALATEEVVPGGPLAVVREELRELAAVQFGRVAADRLFASPVRLAGRPWFQRLTDGRTDLATVREERGLFHLTVAGARRLGPAFPLVVGVDPTLPLTGDLFVPGVRSADPEIRIGDSVVLVRDHELAGVGEAALPGRLMTELERGLAVHVRHREHRTTDTPMTEKESLAGEGPVV